MTTLRIVENQDKDAEIEMLRERITTLSRRVVELMGENQILRDALDLARQRYDDKGTDYVH